MAGEESTPAVRITQSQRQQWPRCRRSSVFLEGRLHARKRTPDSRKHGRCLWCAPEADPGRGDLFHPATKQSTWHVSRHSARPHFRRSANPVRLFPAQHRPPLVTRNTTSDLWRALPRESRVAAVLGSVLWTSPCFRRRAVQPRMTKAPYPYRLADGRPVHVSRHERAPPLMKCYLCGHAQVVRYGLSPALPFV